MKQSYSNPIVTYDEIVNALKAIMECSLNNDKSDNDYLSNMYDQETRTNIDSAREDVLRTAINDLYKAIDTSSKVIKNNLETELKKINDSIIKIDAEYLFGQEKRKIAANEIFVNRLRAASLDTALLYHVEESEVDDTIDESIPIREFEKDIVINFPDFFKEELELAKEEQNTEEDDENLSHLFDTVEVNVLPIESPEELVSQDDNQEELPVVDERRVALIRKAIAKAQNMGDPKLVRLLEERLNKELK